MSVKTDGPIVLPLSSPDAPIGLVGGKGASLARMAAAGLPVPAGFTISTDACNLYYTHGSKLPAHIETEMVAQLRKLEKAAGATLGSTKKPLLVSVRSGAKFSMPGMMDTILNLGLNDQTVLALVKATQNERFAWDCYRRFVQMYGDVVMGVQKRADEGGKVRQAQLDRLVRLEAAAKALRGT